MTHAARPPAARTTAVATRSSAHGHDPDALQSEIEVVRQRLAGTIDELVYRAHPKTILERFIAQAKAPFFDESGAPRTDKIAAAGGLALGVVTVMVVIRKVVNR